MDNNSNTKFKPNYRKQNDLINAIERGDVNNVRMMLSWRMDVNWHINGGREAGCTPLHFAASPRLELRNDDNIGKIIRILIDNGSELNVKNAYGQTPLQVAVVEASEKIAEFLLEAGADPNTADNDGTTILKNIDISALYKDEKARNRMRTLLQKFITNPNYRKQKRMCACPNCNSNLDITNYSPTQRIECGVCHKFFYAPMDEPPYLVPESKKKSFKCRIGMHNWSGCICSSCGTIRDNFHNWDHCICKGCGKTRDSEHKWDGCQCAVCKKTRDSVHSWSGWSCTRCGRKLQDLIEDGKAKWEDGVNRGWNWKKAVDKPLLEAVIFFGENSPAENIEQLAALSVVGAGTGDVAKKAVVALGNIRDKRALPALIRALHFKQEAHVVCDSVVYEAVKALGELGDISAVPILIEFLQDREKPWDSARYIASALAKLGDSRAITPLLDLIQKRDEHGRSFYNEEIRASAARAVGALLGDDISKVMRIAVEGEEAAAREAAIIVLDENGVSDPALGQAVADMWHKHPSERSPRLLKVINRNGGDARLEILRQALQTPGEISVTACRIINVAGGSFNQLSHDVEKAVDALMENIRTKAANNQFNWKFNSESVMMIARVRAAAKPMIPELKELMEHRSPFSMSIWIAGALSVIDETPEIYVRFLLEVMHDADEGRTKHPEISPLLANIPQMKVRIFNVESGTYSSGPSGLMGMAFNYMASHSAHSPWSAAQEALSSAVKEYPEAIKPILMRLKDDYPKQVADVRISD